MSRRASAAPAARVTDLVARARDHDARALARMISYVEDASSSLREVMQLTAPYIGHAHIIGITGSPGVGKSTTTSALVSAFRGRGQRVAVLAVDPSSPFSGGALLGDRVRMQEHATDDGVFIRSMASRGHLGGLAWSTPQALRVIDAAGFDVIIVETVGVGQSEVEVAATADTTVVLLAPGMGDGIQAAKAGILEVGDIFVVNKADRDGADSTARELRHMLTLGERVEGGWTPPVLKSVASRGEGIDEVVGASDAHLDWLKSSDTLAVRRRRRASSEIEAITMATLRARVSDVHGDDRLDSLSECVATGKLDPYAAADLLVERLAQPSALEESSEFAQGLTHPEGEGGFDEWPVQSSDRTQREIDVLGPEEA